MPAIDFQVRDLGILGRAADQPAVDQPVVVAKLPAQLANLQARSIVLIVISRS